MTSRLTDERIAEIRKLSRTKLPVSGGIVFELSDMIGEFRDACGVFLAAVEALREENENIAKEHKRKLALAIDDYYNAWANHQVEMEQLKKQLTQAEAERDVLADACARIVGSPDGQEFPSLVHKGNITKWLKYAQQHARSVGNARP